MCRREEEADSLRALPHLSVRSQGRRGKLVFKPGTIQSGDDSSRILRAGDMAMDHVSREGDLRKIHQQHFRLKLN